MGSQKTNSTLVQASDHALIGLFRHFVRGKFRIAAAWIFVFLLAFFAKDPPRWHGLFLIFLGAILRYWASGYIRKDSHPAIGGPYAFLRNPLYLGTYFMAVGATLAVNNLILFLVTSFIYFTVYHFIVRDEEEKLLDKFGPPFLLYCQYVPRWIPRFSPNKSFLLNSVNPDKTVLAFSTKIAMKNKAYESILTFFALWFFLTLISCFMPRTIAPW